MIGTLTRAHMPHAKVKIVFAIRFVGKPTKCGKPKMDNRSKAKKRSVAIKCQLLIFLVFFLFQLLHQRTIQSQTSGEKRTVVIFINLKDKLKMN